MLYIDGSDHFSFMSKILMLVEEFLHRYSDNPISGQSESVKNARIRDVQVRSMWGGGPL